ncbi:MAG TPA: LamG-like jellyroll fold domain-containing protein [Verrucomicrobiae bacterium]|nr:LamG-like jellyroll fold domain-containing protein [Verrucomicrobiae bacterium]
MKIEFPSSEFDDVVAAVCHGAASEEKARALNELLRKNASALDEYIIRLELHSHLASERDLFASADTQKTAGIRTDRILSLPRGVSGRRSKLTTWTIALAACLALWAAGVWKFRLAERSITTSKAIAMLSRTADAQWVQGKEIPRLGAPLEPGHLQLQAGLAEVSFYCGARLLIEGPADVQLISQSSAFCKNGRIVAEVPNQARGFQIQTPHSVLSDLGGSVGVEVKTEETEVHAFKGTVKVMGYAVEEGLAARIDRAGAVRLIEAQQESFNLPFDLQAKSVAADARRHDQWRTACKRLESDQSLVVHFDFENVAPSGSQLRNLGKSVMDVTDAAIVGCQRTEGRWPKKGALAFQSVSDRVRLTVPGEFQALTLTAWVCVKGLDRKINSLFMSDGFEAGTVHWVIRRDGVLGLTVIGTRPSDYQIVTSPPVISLDEFGTWMHLAVVLDAKRVTHFVNGFPVAESALKIGPPYRVGAAELGNWNPKGFPEKDPFMIRNFSGGMDEFCLFSRALSEREIRSLYSQGRPQPEPIAQNSAVKQSLNP